LPRDVFFGRFDLTFAGVSLGIFADDFWDFFAAISGPFTVLCDRPSWLKALWRNASARGARYVTNQTRANGNRTTDSKDTRARIHPSQPERQ
jgi:hypothetical protein